jgi:hypothetical protein
LYNPTPNKDAIDVTSVTRPRNSGENPSLFVLKKMHQKVAHEDLAISIRCQSQCTYQSNANLWLSSDFMYLG